MNGVEKFNGKKINFQILEDGVRSRKKNMMSEVEKEKLSETWIGGVRGGVDHGTNIEQTFLLLDETTRPRQKGATIV